MFSLFISVINLFEFFIRTIAGNLKNENEKQTGRKCENDLIIYSYRKFLNKLLVEDYVV